MLCPLLHPSPITPQSIEEPPYRTVRPFLPSTIAPLPIRAHDRPSGPRHCLAASHVVCGPWLINRSSSVSLVWVWGVWYGVVEPAPPPTFRAPPQTYCSSAIHDLPVLSPLDEQYHLSLQKANIRPESSYRLCILHHYPVYTSMHFQFFTSLHLAISVLISSYYCGGVCSGGRGSETQEKGRKRESERERERAQQKR